MWNRRIRRRAQQPRRAPGRPAPPRIPRLRLGGRRRHRRRRRHRDAQARRQAPGARRRPRGAPAAPRAAPASATPAGRRTAARPTRNAHPHLGDDGKLALIHNGIIENFSELKAELLAEGYTFTSETDTEVAAVLLGREYRPHRRPHRGVPRTVVAGSTARSRCSRCTRTSPGVVVGARRNSPLVIGLGEGENFLGSDVAAFVEYTEARRGDRPGPDRRRSPPTASPSPTSTATRSRSSRSRSRGTPPPPRRAAGPRSWRKEVAEAARGRREHPARPRRRRRGRASPSSTAFGDEVLRGIRRIIVIACGTAAYAGHGRASTRSSSGRACRSRSSSATSSATATR